MKSLRGLVTAGVKKVLHTEWHFNSDINPQDCRHYCPAYWALRYRVGAVETEAAVAAGDHCVLGVAIQADGALDGG